MSKKDFEKLVSKQTGSWSGKYTTARVKALEKRTESLEAWLAKIATRVLHDV